MPVTAVDRVDSSWLGAGQAQNSADDVYLITPSDTDELPYITRAISIAVEGDLKIVTKRGSTVTIPSGYLAAKVMYSIRAKKVFATGTTATGIVGYD
jgi:hypothetical protein